MFPAILVLLVCAVVDDGPLHISLPLAGLKLSDIHDTFDQVRGGTRKHEATDIMSPRGTPVLAVNDGKIVKLFLSKPGGNTIYQFDPSEQYCYYYAHLDRYAPGLKEGMLLRKGDVLGYVGSTGDASPNAPHLHFAIYLLGPHKRWWKGAPIDPYPVIERSLLMSSRSSPSQVYLILEMLHAGG